MEVKGQLKTLLRRNTTFFLDQLVPENDHTPLEDLVL